jgi:hypothetical protein
MNLGLALILVGVLIGLTLHSGLGLALAIIGVVLMVVGTEKSIGG